MSGVAVAAGATAASAAAAIGGAAMSSSAASKAGKNQAAAAEKSAYISKAAAQDANTKAQELYLEDQRRLAQLYGGTQAGLQPYANAGLTPLQQLQAGTSSGTQARAATAASGTPPDVLARLQSEFDQSGQAVQSAQARVAELEAQGKNLQYTGLQSLPAIRQYQEQFNQAQRDLQAAQANTQTKQQAFEQARSTPYVPAQAAVSAQGAATANQNATFNRDFNVQDYLQDPTTGGTPPPNLTTNFDETAWRQSQGLGPQALTKGFNEQAWLQGQGIGAQDLTSKFDETAWRRSQGLGPKALTKDFNEQKWLQSQGIGARDLTASYDPTSLLNQAGKTKADLVRDFTMQDFQADPGYEFRRTEGLRGLNQQGAARGMQLSGATLKALNKYGQNVASEEYGNAFNRYQTQRQNLSNEVTNQYNRFGQNQANRQQERNTAFTQFGQNQANKQQERNTAYNQFGQNQANQQQERNNAFNRFGVTQANQQSERDKAYSMFGENRQQASNVYGNAFDRWSGQQTNKFNRLASLAGIGQTAATQQGQFSQNYGNQASGAAQQYSTQFGNNLLAGAGAISEGTQNAAAARAAGTVGSANAWNTGLGQVSKGLMDYAASQNQNDKEPLYDKYGNRVVRY